MSRILIFFSLIIFNTFALAKMEIVKGHIANNTIWVEVYDYETNTLQWHSSEKVGVVNSVFGCTGTNCIATNLKIRNNSIYGDIFVLFEAKPSLKDIFVLDIHKENKINPSELGFVVHHGENIILVYGGIKN